MFLLERNQVLNLFMVCTCQICLDREDLAVKTAGVVCVSE